MLENLLRIGLATPSDLQAVGFTNSEIAAAAGTTIPPAKAATPHRRSPDPHAAAAARHSNGSRSEEEEEAGAHHESSAKKLLDGAGGKQSTPPARDSHGHRERRSKRSGVVRSRSQSDDAESEKEPSSSPSSSNSSDSSSSSQWTLTARESEAPPPRTASAAATTTTTTDAVNAAPSHSDPHDVTSLTTDVTKASVSEESREAHLRASALVERARVLNTGPGSPWLGHGPSLSYPASSAPETPTSRSMHPPSTNWGVPRLIPDDENQEPCNAPPTTTTTTTTNAAGGESGKNSALRFTGVDAMVAKEIAWHLQQKEHMVEEREEPLEE